MSKVLWAGELCERALRMIGACSINDSAPNPLELAETAYWLDMVVAEKAQTERLTFFIEATVTIALTADTVSYDLETAMGSDYPTDDVMFITNAYVTNGTTDIPLKIVRRKTYEDEEVKAASGKPEILYLDRLDGTTGQTFFIHPVPADTTWSLKLIFQRGGPDMATAPGTTRHNMPNSWQLWMVRALGYEIGCGPVRKLQENELARIKRDRDESFKALQGSANKETHVPRRAAAHGA